MMIKTVSIGKKVVWRTIASNCSDIKLFNIQGEKEVFWKKWKLN